MLNVRYGDAFLGLGHDCIVQYYHPLQNTVSFYNEIYMEAIIQKPLVADYLVAIWKPKTMRHAN